jgi:hypothetical protein
MIPTEFLVRLEAPLGKVIADNTVINEVLPTLRKGTFHRLGRCVNHSLRAVFLLAPTGDDCDSIDGSCHLVFGSCECAGLPDPGRCLLRPCTVQARGKISLGAAQSEELLPLRVRLRGVGRAWSISAPSHFLNARQKGPGGIEGREDDGPGYQLREPQDIGLT